MPTSRFALHEVFYDDAGNRNGCPLEPIDFHCDIEEGPAGIARSLKMALDDARKRPALDATIFEADPQQAELWRTQLELIRALKIKIPLMTEERLAELKGLIVAFVGTGSAEEFFARGKRLAHAADNGEVLREAHIVTYEDPSDRERFRFARSARVKKPSGTENS